MAARYSPSHPTPWRRFRNDHGIRGRADAGGGQARWRSRSAAAGCGPARNPYSDEAIEARYHTTVIARRGGRVTVIAGIDVGPRFLSPIRGRALGLALA